jgi:hypothetical protein
MHTHAHIRIHTGALCTLTQTRSLRACGTPCRPTASTHSWCQALATPVSAAQRLGDAGAQPVLASWADASAWGRQAAGAGGRPEHGRSCGGGGTVAETGCSGHGVAAALREVGRWAARTRRPPFAPRPANAGMEAAIANLLEPGEKIIVGNKARSLLAAQSQPSRVVGVVLTGGSREREMGRETGCGRHGSCGCTWSRQAGARQRHGCSSRAWDSALTAYAPPKPSSCRASGGRASLTWRPATAVSACLLAVCPVSTQPCCL